MTSQPETGTMPPVFEKRLAVEDDFYCGIHERGSENVLLAAADAAALTPFVPVIERSPGDIAVLAFRGGGPSELAVAAALRTLVPLLARYARVTLLGADIPPALFTGLGAAVKSAANILLLESLPEGFSPHDLPGNTALFHDGTNSARDAPVRAFLDARPGLAVNCPFAAPRMTLALAETGVARNLFFNSPADESGLRAMCGEAATMFAHGAPWSAAVIANEFSRKGLTPERMAMLKQNRPRLILSPKSAGNMEAALASEGRDNAEKLFAGAVLLTREGRDVEAGKCFCLAALGNPGNPFYQAKAAEVYVKCGLWNDAARTYKAAIRAAAHDAAEYRPLLPALHFDLVKVMAVRGNETGAAGLLTAGLDFESTKDRHERFLVTGVKKNFIARREIYRFVRRNLDRIRAGLDNDAPTDAQALPDTIFTYWDKGIDNAPELVRNCRRLLLRNNPDSRIVELDDGNMAEYADIPAFIMDRYAAGRITNPFFSDILRVLLLQKHGGMWLDATCFCPEPVWPRLSELARNGLFLFRYPNDRLLSSNWCIAAAKGNRVMALMAGALAAYWQEYNNVLDYYIFHHILAAFSLLDPGTKQAFAAMSFVDTRLAHALQKRMFEAYNERTFSMIRNGCFIHKLTYKTCADGCREGSYLHRLGLLAPVGENGGNAARG